MEPSEHRIRQIVLQRIGHCRVCHRQHEGGDVNMVSQKPDVWMMMVECPDCHTRSFVAAVVDENRADEARNALQEMAIELSIRDVSGATVELPAPADPLTEDDVSDMRDFLESFNGDFKRLFNAKG
jgi:predicted  nucleic acid-binding Zn-ribbon protein